jgi:hypothetical protein
MIEHCDRVRLFATDAQRLASSSKPNLLEHKIKYVAVIAFDRCRLSKRRLGVATQR